jgi:DNA protecting protein DprA
MAGESDAVAIIALLGLPGVGPAKIHKVLGSARRRGLSLWQALDDKEGLKTLGREQLGRLEHARVKAQELAEAVGGRKAAFLPITDDRYPSTLRRHLGSSAPPLLTVSGNESLLDRHGVGFCGSRAASEKGLGVASDVATQLAEAGLNIVSGYASGVDATAHKAALRARGTTIVVLAEGILNFSVKKDIRELWDEKRVAVVSEFAPNSVWSVHNAMRRNRTICGLSHALILIEARSKGGSFEAGKAALELGIPLFAAAYEGSPESAAGNRELMEAGARGLLKSRSSGRANVAPIFEAVRMEIGSMAPSAQAL